jgi:hypothetical protein
LRFAAVLALALAGCNPPQSRSTPLALERGRIYTRWLYGNEYGKLWDRLTPEMRQVFGSASELGKFAGKAVTRLGQERGAVDERVADIRPDQIYSRTASFSSSRRPVTIEWSLTKDGAVSGLVVRPADTGSAATLNQPETGSLKPDSRSP